MRSGSLVKWAEQFPGRSGRQEADGRQRVGGKEVCRGEDRHGNSEREQAQERVACSIEAGGLESLGEGRREPWGLGECRNGESWRWAREGQRQREVRGNFDGGCGHGRGLEPLPLASLK